MLRLSIFSAFHPRPTSKKAIWSALARSKFDRFYASRPQSKISVAKLYDYVFGENPVEKRLRQATTPASRSKIESYRAQILQNRQREIAIFFEQHLSEATKIRLSHIFSPVERSVENDAAPLEVSINVAEYTSSEMYQEIQKQFLHYNRMYRYFSHDEIQQRIFYQYVKAIKFYVDVFECIDSRIPPQSINQISLSAYKVMVLFHEVSVEQGLAKLDQYLQHFLDVEERPLQKCLDFVLPANEPAAPLPLAQWRKLIMQHGTQVLRLFADAHLIKQVMLDAPLKDLDQIIKACAQIYYPRYSENPEMAYMFAKYRMDNHLFEESLLLYANRKRIDLLPDVLVDGAEYGHAGYYLTKLPMNDPRAFVLGHETHCCQSYGDLGEECVISGVSVPSNGFYVLLERRRTDNSVNMPTLVDGRINDKHYQIVGQCYAALTLAGNLLVDSWENKHHRYDGIIVNLLPIMAKQIMMAHPTISRVVIGRGGHTPDLWKRQYRSIKQREEVLAGYRSLDADLQTEVQSRRDVLDGYSQQIQAKLKKLNLTRDVFTHFMADNRLHSVKQQTAVATLLSFTSVTQCIKRIQSHVDIGSHAQFDVAFLLYHFLEIEKKAFFADITANCWRDLLWRVDVLARTLEMLNRSEQAYLLQQLGREFLQQLCFTLTDVEHIVRRLDAENTLIFLDLLSSDYLNDMLVCKDELYTFLQSVPPALYVEVVQVLLQHNVYGILRDPTDWMEFIRQVPAPQRRAVLESTKVLENPLIAERLHVWLRQFLSEDDIKQLRASQVRDTGSRQRKPSL